MEQYEKSLKRLVCFSMVGCFICPIIIIYLLGHYFSTMRLENLTILLDENVELVNSNLDKRQYSEETYLKLQFRNELINDLEAIVQNRVKLEKRIIIEQILLWTIVNILFFVLLFKLHKLQKLR